MRVYFCSNDEPECDEPYGEPIDCPDCGGSATVNDSGVVCDNPSCPSNN